ncbi:D-alanyl-D-alanine carboxypeptidase family protein [soil metagenome]
MQAVSQCNQEKFDEKSHDSKIILSSQTLVPDRQVSIISGRLSIPRIIILALVSSLALAALMSADVRAQETTQQQPVAGELAPPPVEAKAWALVDIRTGERLAGKNEDERLPMASTTKIMLALLTVEEASLGEEVVVSPKAASFAVPRYSNVGLFAGDTLTVRELLRASLIASGDDAAYALAEHLGDGSVKQFVKNMNRRADELGLEETRFENPVGFDSRDHHSNARDLAKLARIALDHPEIARAVSTAETAITTQDRTLPLVNTNELLSSYLPATGVKTGTTPAAGPSLVASAEAGNESYLTVVLDDEERFADAIRLLEFGFETYERRNLIIKGETYAEANVPYRREERIDLVARRNVAGLTDDGDEVDREVTTMKEMPASVRPGDRLGNVILKVDGKQIGSIPLVASRGYEEASVGQKVWYTVEGIFE